MLQMDPVVLYSNHCLIVDSSSSDRNWTELDLLSESNTHIVPEVAYVTEISSNSIEEENYFTIEGTFIIKT